MLNLLHSDLSWSWWITHLCRDWRTAVNLIVIFTVLLPIQISRTLVRENLKLFSPGHVSWNRSKQASSPFEIYVLPWQQDYVPNGTSIWNLRLWNFATAILKVMPSKFQTIGPSCSFWKRYRPEWRIRQYNYIESTLLVPGTSQPFVLRLRCHKVSPGVILPWSSATPRKRSFDSLHFDSRGIINTAGYSGVYSSIHGSANLFFKHSASLFVIPLFYILLGIDVFPQLLGLHRAYSCDRFTHGAQTWRHCGWLGLAFEFEPWNLFDQEWHRARLSSFWVESPCCSCSFDLDHLGTSGSKCYSQRPWDYVTIRYLLSPNSTWCTFPDRAKFYLQCLPTLSLLIPRGPSDPIQDLYPLQQHQGVIHWRDPNIRSFEMSWSWTLFLQSVW